MSVGPLGTPDVAPAEQPARSELDGVSVAPGARVLATVGYLAPGVEMVLHAMRLLRDEHPELHYVVAGPTHPDVARRDGERFRWSLEALADDLGLGGRVHLVDRAWATDDHGGLVARAAVVLAPYRAAEHAVTLPLRVAAGAGRPVVLTPPCVPVELDGSDLLTVVGVDDDEECAAAIADAIAATGDADRARNARPS